MAMHNAAKKLPSRERATGVETVQADASDPAVADRLIRELKPDLVVLAAGIQPAMGPLAEQTWESFSETWNTDLKAAFHFMRAAVTTPLREGSAVIVVSSGAAINGSHLSGGYAGAKRMQWLLAGYAQAHANAKKLGIRFLAVLPIQLMSAHDRLGVRRRGRGAGRARESLVRGRAD